jgi:hypothetical protein
MNSMSEKQAGANAEKTEGAKLGADWTAGADGASVSKTYKLGSASEAVKLAKRVLQLAEKAKEPVKIDYDGSSVTVGLGASGGAVNDASRRIARRLDGEKAERPAREPKKANPDQAAKREARKARAERVAKKKAKKGAEA